MPPRTGIKLASSDPLERRGATRRCQRQTKLLLYCAISQTSCYLYIWLNIVCWIIIRQLKKQLDIISKDTTQTQALFAQMLTLPKVEFVFEDSRIIWDTNYAGQSLLLYLLSPVSPWREDNELPNAIKRKKTIPKKVERTLLTFYENLMYGFSLEGVRLHSLANSRKFNQRTFFWSDSKAIDHFCKEGKSRAESLAGFTGCIHCTHLNNGNRYVSKIHSYALDGAWLNISPFLNSVFFWWIARK